MEIERGGRIDSSVKTAEDNSKTDTPTDNNFIKQELPDRELKNKTQASQQLLISFEKQDNKKNTHFYGYNPNKALALLLTFFVAIPLLAAFAGNSGEYSIETTTTAMTAATTIGSYIFRTTTTTQGAFDSGISGTYLLDAGWFEANTKPTQVQPLINSTYGQNLTLENITIYNQTFVDVDDDALTRIINWYRNGTSIAVLNMPFEKNDPFTAQDYSGYGNNGIVYGASWNRSGIVGGGYIFDGVNDYLDIGDKDVFTMPTGFTVSAWVNKKTGTLSPATILSKWPDAVSREFGIGYYSDNKIYFDVYDENANAFIGRTAPAPSINTWHHIAGTYNGGVDNAAVKIYIDGVQSDTGNYGSGTFASIQNTIANLTIGQATNLLGANSYFNGTIDDIRIYNSSLTAEQIAADYRNGLPNYDTITPSMTKVGDRWNARVWANDNLDDSDANATQNITINACGDIYSSVVLDENITATNNCHTLKNDGITFDCGQYNITGNGAGVLINATNLDFITIKDCRISNAVTGIYLNNTNNSIIKNSFLTGMGSLGEGISLKKGQNITILNNTFGPALYGIATNNGGQNLYIYNNTFDMRIGLTAAATINRMNATVIENNTFYNSTTYGILIGIQTATNITRNTFTDSGRHISTTQSNDLLIWNNVFAASTVRGIDLGTSKRTKIINNTIDNSRYAVYIVTSNDTLVENNSIRHADTALILIDDANYTTIRNNTLENASHGIYMADAVETLIHNNRITDMYNKSNSIINDTSAGIRIESSAMTVQNTKITNNTLRNNYVGIFVWKLANNTLIANNTIQNSSFNGIFSLYGLNSTIQDNQFLNNGNTSFTASEFEPKEYKGTISTTTERDDYLISVPVNTRVAVWVESAGNGTHSGVINFDIYDSANRDIMMHRAQTINYGRWIEGGTGLSANADTLNVSLRLANQIVNFANGKTTTATRPENYSLFIIPFTKSSIQLAKEENSLIQNITTNDPIGIWAINSSGVTIKNITFEGTPTKGMHFINSLNTTIQNTTIAAPAIFQTLDGWINFTTNIQLSGQRNISGIINITQSHAYVKSATAPEFNTTALITLKNITLANPHIFYDEEDDSYFDLCPISRCTFLDYTASNYTFNATRFTTYKIDSIGSSCLNVTVSMNMTANINANDSCINLNANNIIFDCDGYNITGNSIGTAINISGREGITIKNCNLANFTTGIETTNSNSNNLTNNTITGTITALQLNGTNGYWLKNNTITTNTYNLHIIDNFNTTLYGDIIQNPIFEHSTHARINYTQTITINQTTNLQAAINLSELEIYVNNSNYPFLNTTATLFFRSAREFVAPKAAVKYEHQTEYSLCPNEICTQNVWNKTHNTHSYDVTHFTRYSILETRTFPSEKGGAAGTATAGGGGWWEKVGSKQVRCIIDEECEPDEKCINNQCLKLFDLKIMRADSPVEQTDVLDFTFLMKSMADVDGDVTLEYWIQKPGEAEKLARAQDVIYMKGYQTKIEDAALYLYKDLLGEYELVVQLSFEGYTIQAITPIEIVERALTILTTELIEFEPPKFKLKISTNKDREIAVKITEIIKSENKTVWQNRKEIGVKKTADIEENIGRLKQGTYELTITTEADGKINEITRTFTIEKTMPETEMPGATGRLKNLLLMLLYGLGIVGALAITFYIGKTVATEERIRHGRKEVAARLSSMRKQLEQWQKKGFNTSKMRGMFDRFRISDVRKELAGGISKAGEGIAKQAKTIADAGTTAFEKIKGAGEGAGAITSKAIEKATETGRGTIAQLRKAGNEAGRIGIATISGAGETAAKAASSMQEKLLRKIRYWKSIGIDTSIVERKLAQLKERIIPKAPMPAKMPEAPMPVKKETTMRLPAKPIIKMPEAPKPQLTTSKPAYMPQKITLIKTEREATPILSIEKRALQKPIIKAEKIQKELPKPEITAKTTSEKDTGSQLQKRLEEKLQKWKSAGFDTAILERKLEAVGQAKAAIIKIIKKPEIGKIKALETAKPSEQKDSLEALKEKIQQWKKLGYDTTLLEKKLMPAKQPAQTKERQPAKTAADEVVEKLEQKIREWKSKGFDTTVLETNLKKLKRYKPEKPEYKREKSDKRIIEKLAEWRAKGYDTKVLERQLSQSEETELEIKTLEDKIKLWKEKGYDTRILEQKLRELKR